MSTILRSALIVVALLGSASVASAHGHHHGYWSKSSHGAWKKHDTRTFFDRLRKNGS